MIARPLLLVALYAATLFVVPENAQAQGIWDFFRRKPREEQAPRPAPPPPRAPRERAAPPKPKPVAPPPPVVAAPPKPLAPAPYEKDMQRLGEIMGALHYLRPLCGADDGPVWRDKMNELMQAEAGPQDSRERLAGAFNSGYEGFQLTYRTCTPAARTVVRRYLDEGSKLARDITTRHGY